MSLKYVQKRAKYNSNGVKMAIFYKKKSQRSPCNWRRTSGCDAINVDQLFSTTTRCFLGKKFYCLVRPPLIKKRSCVAENCLLLTNQKSWLLFCSYVYTVLEKYSTYCRAFYDFLFFIILFNEVFVCFIDT